MGLGEHPKSIGQTSVGHSQAQEMMRTSCHRKQLQQSTHKCLAGPYHAASMAKTAQQRLQFPSWYMMSGLATCGPAPGAWTAFSVGDEFPGQLYQFQYLKSTG